MARRHYTVKDKARAVGIALVEGQREAERQTGIPQKTIDYWMDDPAFAQLRSRTREEVALEFWTVIQLAVKHVKAGLEGDEPLRDKAQALGVLYDRYALLSGQATSRTEHRDLTADLDDHEKATLRDLIEGALAEPAQTVAGGDKG